MLLFIIDVLCFSPRGEMEREDCGVVLFFTDSLNSVCADIAGTDSSQVESHMSTTTSRDSHRRDRQYKISVKKQTHTWIWGRLGALRACFGLVTH